MNHFETYCIFYCQTTQILKTLGQFENLVFVIMSTRENIRLIARSSLELVYEKKNGSLVFSGSRKIPTRGPTVPVGNEACPPVHRSVGNSASVVSHWKGGPSGRDFSVPI